MVIRILHVLASLNRAGTETLLLNLYRNIDRQTIQFDFAISAKSHCEYEDEVLNMGGIIYRYPAYKGINHLEYMRWWKNFFRAHPEYHIVHGHIGSTAAIYLGMAKRFGRYTIAHSHGTLEPTSIRSVIWRTYSFPTRFIADYFLGCSMMALETRYGRRTAHGNRAKILKNAIDSSLYSYDEDVRNQVRKEFHIENDKLVIGTAGRLSAQKNPHMIIKILTELKKRNIDYLFLWSGIGEMQGEIEAELKKNNLTEVHMLGLRNDVNRLLQAMDVFLFPSIWEGLGIAVIEAQAAGLLTLCSEEVPPEAKATKLCKFLSLDHVDLWCDEILKYCDYERKVTQKDIINAGYDIKKVSKWLQTFYRKTANIISERDTL